MTPSFERAMEAFYSMDRIRRELRSSPQAQEALFCYVAFGRWSRG